MSSSLSHKPTSLHFKFFSLSYYLLLSFLDIFLLRLLIIAAALPSNHPNSVRFAYNNGIGTKADLTPDDTSNLAVICSLSSDRQIKVASADTVQMEHRIGRSQEIPEFDLSNGQANGYVDSYRQIRNICCIGAGYVVSCLDFPDLVYLLTRDREDQHVPLSQTRTQISK